MRYELYEKFEDFHIFICETDSFSEVTEKAEGKCIIIDNKEFKVSCNFPDANSNFNKEAQKDLIFACKFAKACYDIKSTDAKEIQKAIDLKEQVTQKECDLFISNMK